MGTRWKQDGGMIKPIRGHYTIVILSGWIGESYSVRLVGGGGDDVDKVKDE